MSDETAQRANRGICSGCGAIRHVRVDGLIRWHRSPSAFGALCDGSNKPPYVARRYVTQWQEEKG